METIKYIYEHAWDTVCFLIVISVCISAVVLAIRGKSFW